jgi:hypothetical protein
MRKFETRKSLISDAIRRNAELLETNEQFKEMNANHCKYNCVGYSVGIYGANAAIFKDNEGKYYYTPIRNNFVFLI